MDFDGYDGGPLDTAVDLVNTLETVGGADRLADEASLVAFLERHGYPVSGGVGAAELERARAAREALRRVFTAPDEGAAAATLNAVIADCGAVPQLTDHDGTWHLHFVPSRPSPVERLVAESAIALGAVIAERGFDRLHVCEGRRCADVFVDRSRNRSRRFCSPEVCGNRMSVAAHRARRKQAGS